MDPITGALAAQGLTRVLDLAFTMLAAGMNRSEIQKDVQKMEFDGKTLEEIATAMQTRRRQSEVDAQAKIDAMPDAGDA